MLCSTHPADEQRFSVFYIVTLFILYYYWQMVHLFRIFFEVIPNWIVSRNQPSCSVSEVKFTTSPRFCSEQAVSLLAVGDPLRWQIPCHHQLYLAVHISSGILLLMSSYFPKRAAVTMDHLSCQSQWVYVQCDPEFISHTEPYHRWYTWNNQSDQ